MKDISWFEMRDVRSRWLDKASWIPLREARDIFKVGEFGELGYVSEFFGVGSVAIALDQKTLARDLDWNEIGISRNHSGRLEQDQYLPVDLYRAYGSELSGIHLVLDQYLEAHNPEWHLHQDLVVTLGLLREGDVWVCPSEDFVEVAKLARKDDGKPMSLQIRATFLKDYLCARRMGLLVTSYRQRMEICATRDHIPWTKSPVQEVSETDRWEGRADKIRAGGAFGSEWHVMKVWREDAALQDDVPDLGFDSEAFRSESFSTNPSNELVYQIQGELWRTEWVNPGSASVIVRGDKLPDSVSFIVDAEGKRETKSTLESEVRWLWFQPAVINAILGRRGGYLGWYSRETGSVGIASTGVHFGINSSNLINVFAKDIALLPDWQQQIWAAYNVPPEGGVSNELMDSQMRCEPASTKAPEAFLTPMLYQLNKVSQEKLGFKVLNDHEYVPRLIPTIHRFRSLDSSGLLELAKDLNRVIIERINSAAIRKFTAPPGNDWGSLKVLQHMLSSWIGSEKATAVMGRLFGLYELRKADAHLPGSELQRDLVLAGINPDAPPLTQGYQLLRVSVTTVFTIAQIIEKVAPKVAI